MTKNNKAHYIVGYGSLLNHDSRLRFSNLDIQPIHVRLHGWQRCWHARSYPENQTFVGVESAAGADLNAALIPTQTITDELRQRERDYQFIEIELNALTFQDELTAQQTDKLNHSQFWICHPTAPKWPTADFPVYQSYVDTCLAGALESGDPNAAHEFIESTLGWQHHWLDDRDNPQYPRIAKLDQAQTSQIDEVLHQSGLLKYRK